MKVILTAPVPKLGKPGDVKEVPDGYAKNFLIAKGLAVPAVGNAAKRVGQEIAASSAKRERARGELEEFAKRISATSLALGVKAGEGGRLFGSVTTADIAEALGRHGIQIDKHQVQLDEPLKQLGTYRVQVRVAAHLVAEVTVTVEAKA